MKKSFFTVSLFALVLLTGSLLCAQTKKIPILWKTKDAAPAKFQLLAFGYLNDKDDVIFAFEINNLEEFMKLDSHLSQYYNADNDVKTGRFPNSLGVDLQINGRLKSKQHFGPLKWTSQTKYKNLPGLKGEKAFAQKGNVVFYILSKQMLDGIVFKPQFSIGASFYVKGMKPAPKGISGSVKVDTAKVLGNFEMPELK